MVLSIQRPPKSNEQVVGEPDAPDNLAAAEAEAAFELRPASLRPSTSLLPSTRKPAPLSFSGQESRFPRMRRQEPASIAVSSSAFCGTQKTPKDAPGGAEQRPLERPSRPLRGASGRGGSLGRESEGACAHASPNP